MRIAQKLLYLLQIRLLVQISDILVTDPDGNATISFSAQSLESMPSSSAKVMISGMTNQTKRFNGEEWVYFKVPVTVPVDAEKTFSFTVTIKEEGCPSYTRTIERTIKHYNLQ